MPDRKTKSSQLSNWARDYDKLKEEYSKKEIIDICKWARKDDFWKDNFFAPTKLLKKDKTGTEYIYIFKQKMQSEKDARENKHTAKTAYQRKRELKPEDILRDLEASRGTIENIGTELSSLVVSPKIDNEDFMGMLLKLSVNFGVSFGDHSSLDFLKASDIFERCRELGFTKFKFKVYLDNFLDNQRWDSFTGQIS